MNKIDLLNDRIVVLGVSGVSTACKSVALIERLRNLGAEVRVILNDEAEKFVTPLTFERISGHRVTSPARAPDGDPEEDIESLNNDITVIAPASFSFIGKLASGIKDDFLTRFVSTSNRPVIISPSMNENLYSSQIAQSQLSQLRERGYHTVPPKPLGPNDRGQEDLPLSIVPEGIIEKIRDVFREDQLLRGRKVLVTSGPTLEPFGAGEGTGGQTSGSLGYRLSRQARGMGAEVLLASGPTEQIPPPGVGVVWVRTVEELDELLDSEGSKYDLILLADSARAWSAGVKSDPLGGEKTKRFDLEIQEVPDLARKLGLLKHERQRVIEFSSEAETEGEKPYRLTENDIDGCFTYPVEVLGEADVDQYRGTFLFQSGETRKIRARNTNRLSRKILKEVAERYFTEER